MDIISKDQEINLTPREAEVIILKGIINNKERRESLIDLISTGKISEELKPLFIAVLMILENKDSMEPADLLEMIPDESLATALFENLPTDEETNLAEEVFKTNNNPSKQIDQAIIKIATWKRAIDSLSDKLGTGEITPELWVERVLNLLPSPSREKEKELREALEQREAEIELIKKDRAQIKAEAEKQKSKNEEIKSIEASLRLKDAAIESLNSQIDDLKSKLEKEKLNTNDIAIKSQSDENENKIKQLEKDTEDLLKELDTKDNEIKRLNSEIEGMAKEADSEINRLNEEMKAMANEADSEIHRLNEEMKAMANEADSEIKTLNEQIKILNEKAEEKTAEIEDIKLQVEARSEEKALEIKKLNEEIEHLKTQLKEENQQNKILRESSDESSNDIIEALKKESEENIKRLEKEAKEKDDFIQTLKDSLEKSKNQEAPSESLEIEKLRKEFEDLKKSKDAEIAEKEEKLSSIKTKAKALLQKTKERESMYELSKQENESLNRQLKDAKEEVLLECQKRKICEHEKKRLEKEISILKQESKKIKQGETSSEEVEKSTSMSSSNISSINNPAENLETARESVSDETWKSVLDNVQNGVPAVYMPIQSGFDLINSAIGGISGLSVIYGGPKKGKTSLALQLATEAMIRNSDICFMYYTTESLPEALYCKMISQISGINLSTLSSGKSVTLDEQEKDLLRHTCGIIDDCRNRFAIIGMENIALNDEYFKLQLGALMDKNDCDRCLFIIDSMPVFIEASARRNNISPSEVLSGLRKLINMYGIAIIGTAYDASSSNKIMEEISYSADSIYEIISDREEKTDSECIDLPIGITSRNSASFKLSTTFNPSTCRFSVRSQRFKARKITPQEQKGPKMPDMTYSQKKPSLF